MKFDGTGIACTLSCSAINVCSDYASLLAAHLAMYGPESKEACWCSAVSCWPFYSASSRRPGIRSRATSFWDGCGQRAGASCGLAMSLRRNLALERACSSVGYGHSLRRPSATARSPVYRRQHFHPTLPLLPAACLFRCAWSPVRDFVRRQRSVCRAGGAATVSLRIRRRLSSAVPFPLAHSRLSAASSLEGASGRVSYPDPVWLFVFRHRVRWPCYVWRYGAVTRSFDPAGWLFVRALTRRGRGALEPSPTIEHPSSSRVAKQTRGGLLGVVLRHQDSSDPVSSSRTTSRGRRQRSRARRTRHRNVAATCEFQVVMLRALT